MAVRKPKGVATIGFVFGAGLDFPIPLKVSKARTRHEDAITRVKRLAADSAHQPEGPDLASLTSGDLRARLAG